MSAQIQQWHQKIDGLTGEFKERFSDMQADELNRKPNAETWSIAENLQHLITVNESYFPTIEQMKQGKYKPPFLGKISFFVNFMGKTILKSVSPESRKKIRTFPMWEPVAANIHNDIVSRFDKHQSALKDAITSSKEFINKGIVISSPANHNIVYTLGKAFEIMISHEERHLHQAIEAFEVIYKNQYKYDL
jgi:hypothetical protein